MENNRCIVTVGKSRGEDSESSSNFLNLNLESSLLSMIKIRILGKFSLEMIKKIYKYFSKFFTFITTLNSTNNIV